MTRFPGADGDKHSLFLGYTGREQLRTRGTYVVIKLAHEAEKDEKVRERKAFDKAVQRR